MQEEQRKDQVDLETFKEQTEQGKTGPGLG